MENLLEEVKSKFVSVSKDFATVEMRINDELSCALGEDMNPVNFSNRMRKLKERCDELEPKLKKLFECKLKMASILEQQLHNYGQLEDLQKYSDSKISDSYLDIRIECSKTLDNWHSTYRKTLRHQLEEDALKQSNYSNRRDELSYQMELSESTDRISNKIEDDNGATIPTDDSTTLFPVNFEPINQELFDSVPVKLRERCHLKEINQIYSILWSENEKHGSFHSISKETLHKQYGLHLHGRSGEAKLEILKLLKVIQISNNVISLTKEFKPKPSHYPYYLKTTKPSAFKNRKI